MPAEPARLAARNDGQQHFIKLAARAVPNRFRGLRLDLRIRLDHQQRQSRSPGRRTRRGRRSAGSACFVLREWNFRAPSGFTAVGLRRDDSAHSINGVLFRVPAADAFDSREAGYERLPISPPDLRILSPAADDDATRHAAARARRRPRALLGVRAARVREREREPPDLPDVRRRLRRRLPRARRRRARAALGADDRRLVGVLR